MTYKQVTLETDVHLSMRSELMCASKRNNS